MFPRHGVFQGFLLTETRSPCLSRYDVWHEKVVRRQWDQAMYEYPRLREYCERRLAMLLGDWGDPQPYFAVRVCWNAWASFAETARELAGKIDKFEEQMLQAYQATYRQDHKFKDDLRRLSRTTTLRLAGGVFLLLAWECLERYCYCSHDHFHHQTSKIYTYSSQTHSQLQFLALHAWHQTTIS